MSIICPDCEGRVPLYAVDLERSTATCRGCRELFDCTKALPARLVRHTPVVLPKGMTLEVFERESPSLGPYRSGSPELGALTIRRRWRASARALPLRTVLTFSWWCCVPYSRSIFDDRSATLAFVLYCIAIGLGLSYSLLADLLNSSTIVADAHMLVVRHGPLSVRRAVRLRVPMIARIGCKEVPSNQTRHGQPPPTYLVWAGTRSKQGIALIDNLPEPTQALYIAQQLAGHLALGKPAG